jgi:hypothetical protein
VVLQIVLNLKRAPRVWAQVRRSVSVFRSQVLSAENPVSSFADFSHRMQQHEELTLVAPIFKKLSARRHREEAVRGTRMHSRVAMQPF